MSWRTGAVIRLFGGYASCEVARSALTLGAFYGIGPAAYDMTLRYRSASPRLSSPNRARPVVDWRGCHDRRAGRRRFGLITTGLTS